MILLCNKNTFVIYRLQSKEICMRYVIIQIVMMTSSNGNLFRVTGPFCGEFTGHRWIPLTKASDAEPWCFLWSVARINGWVNIRVAGDLRRYRAHYDVMAMYGAVCLDTSREWYHISYFVKLYYCCHKRVPSPSVVYELDDIGIRYSL